jgi:hypothetical protein
VDVERAFGLRTGNAPIDDNNLSPRASLTYDVNGDASSVIRVGGGLFYGRVPYVLGSNVSITDRPLLTLTCSGATGSELAPPDPADYGEWTSNGNENPLECAGASRITGVPEYTFWHDGFELPETFKANLGYSRRLTDRTTATLDLLASTSRKLYTVRNLNLRDAQFTIEGEGGRRIYVPEALYVPSSAAASGAGPERLRNTDFSNVYVNYNDGAARSAAASLRLDHRVSDSTSVTASYTYTRAEDNSSYSCCTATEGYRDTRVGVFGPNEIGAAGDEDRAWGPSDYVRNHVVVLSGFTRLPFGVRLSGTWRVQSGRPWSPEVQADLNGDGERFNDRPYIYRPSELPVFVPTANRGSAEDSLAFVAGERALYAELLGDYECVGDHQGGIIPRNSCRQPWFASLDLSLRKRFQTRNRQGVELSVDLFNVLNGLSSKWGRNREVTAANRNLFAPQGYDAATNQVLYQIPKTSSGEPMFGNRTEVGVSLIQQFSAQVGLRLFF